MEADAILEKIHAAAMRFLISLSFEETYKIIVDEAISLVDAEYGSIILAENNEWKRVYASSQLANKITSRRKGNTYKAFNSNKVIIADITETGKFHPELKKQGVKSTIYIPLSYQDKPLGVLSINAKKKIEQSASELKALKLYGSMATIVIRKAQLYKETKDALETRDFFISLASHELRTPLTSINGYIQLLYSRMAQKDTVESKWVKELYDESKRMTNLIQELLEINRIKQGTLQFVLREVDLHDLSKKAIEKCQALHPKRKITLTSKVTAKAMVIGDGEKLLQVIISILQNAIKFSPESSALSMVRTILVVEDDKGLQKYLKELLLDNGYAVHTAGDGIAALEYLKKSLPDVVVMDLGLPNMSGEAVTTEVRKKYPELPIIILTAKDSISDIVQGLNLGADDYMTKPFVADEFLARIKARLRRTENGDAKLHVADLSLDSKTLEVKRGEKIIQLTPQEFKLLQYLMSNKGRILTREMILNRIWLYSSEIETRVVDVYMGYLRKKIDTGYSRKLLHSVRGFGYVIKE